MTQKKFILNADNLGENKNFNKAILEGYSYGLLKSASILANGEAFEEAVDLIIPNTPDLDIGINLNITKDFAISKGCFKITNDKELFKYSFANLLLKSFDNNDELLFEEIENEFRAQIEKVLNYTNISNITSYQNVHLIPRIFKITCKLASEYNIPFIKTKFESPYFIPDMVKYLTLKFPKNILKLSMLNLLTSINEAEIKKYNLKTNDYIIENNYKSMVNSLTIVYGLHRITYDKVIVEAVIEPCRYEDGTINNHFTQYQLTKNIKLKNKIEALGYEITNYKNIIAENI